MSDNLYDDILEIEAQEVDSFEDVYQTQSLLIFTVGEAYYAVESVAIREILRNTEVFSVPFVPSYVKGVLNYYSKPFAVVDFSMFLGEGKQDAKMFMVLNDESSVALQITDIQEFTGESDLQNFTENANTDYFKGAIRFNETIVPILNVANILTKVRADIEKN